MSTSSLVENSDDCVLKFDFFSYVVIFGILQAFVGVMVSFYADRIGKRLILSK